MASTLTPNMSLVVPGVGTQSGSQYATDINSDLSLLDTHDHSSGKGIQVTPAGLNINSNLSINNNNLTNVTALTLSPTVISQANASLYCSGVDLYFKDVNGNAIQMTASGLVNATSSGIASGTATASFVAGALVVNAAANTPANIQGGSLLMGNNTAASNFLTLAPPTAMGSSFTLTLPTPPASTKIMTMDASGNIGAAYGVDNSTIEVSGNNLQVKDQGITQAKKAIRTMGTSVALGGLAISASCGHFSTSSGSYVSVTNLSITIVTGGNPVFVGLIDDGNLSNESYISPGGSSMDIQITRDATALTASLCSATTVVSSMNIIDSGASAASHTYTVQILDRNPGAGPVGIERAKLIAYEL